MTSPHERPTILVMLFLYTFRMIKAVWIVVSWSSLGEERHNLMTPNLCHAHVDNLDGKRGTEAVQIWISKWETCHPVMKNLVRLDIKVVPRMGNLWVQY